MKSVTECKACSKHKGIQGNLALCQRDSYTLVIPMTKDSEYSLQVTCIDEYEEDRQLELFD